MEKTAIDDVDLEVAPGDVHSVRRPVSKALGFTDFAMNYFELEPGEAFSSGYHTHHDQEEVFYVQEGTAVFDTDEGEITVEAGEVIRFAPGDFQQGYNAENAEERVVGFAFGAPGAKHDWDQIESLVFCRRCEEEQGHGLSITDSGGFELTCSACGDSFVID